MKKTIGLVAHDNRKKDLLDWVTFNAKQLSQHKLICTGTTGKLVKELLASMKLYPTMEILKSGPLGGDQEMGAKISNGAVDMLIFLWDPMTSQPHDPDVKALLRLTVLYNIPTACNRSTADYMIASHVFNDANYKRTIRDYSSYIKREI